MTAKTEATKTFVDEVGNRLTVHTNGYIHAATIGGVTFASDSMHWINRSKIPTIQAFARLCEEALAWAEMEGETR